MATDAMQMMDSAEALSNPPRITSFDGATTSESTRPRNENAMLTSATASESFRPWNENAMLTSATASESIRPWNENAMLTSAPQPSLPADKQYHVMFSFQSEDRVWVRRMLETLEAPPYNLKCCFADRDLHPGREVMQNIEVCMHESMNIVLVMSPEHLDSHYCDFETNMAIELHQEKKGRVIPVLRRGEIVPGSLRFINYIDARDGVNECEVIEKLAAAITKDTDKKSLSRSYNLMDTQFKNGEEVGLSSSRRPMSAMGLTTISDMTTSHLQACHRLGIQVTMSHASMLLSLANSCSFVRDHWLLYTHKGRLVLWFTISLWLSNVTSVILILTVPAVAPDFPTQLIIWLMPLQWALYGGGVMAAIVFFWRLIAQKRRASFSGLISLHTYKRKLLFAIGDKENNVIIRFIRYDVLNCQEYIRENLVSVDDLGPRTRVDEMTRLILEAGIKRYIKVLIDSSPVAPICRHAVRRDVVCLCQYIEMEQIHQHVQWKHAEQNPESQSHLARLI